MTQLLFTLGHGTATRDQLFELLHGAGIESVYAAHMRSASFGTAVDELLAAAAITRTAVLRAESVWWRCHRRMIADFAVLARGVSVEHVMPGGRRQTHRPTDGVRLREDGLLVYDGTR